MSARGLLMLAGLAVSACGDPRDAQLPLSPGRSNAPPPVFERVPARAFATLDIRGPGDADAAVCPLNLSLALGTSCRLATSRQGTCGALSDGEQTTVQCTIRPLTLGASEYDVDLLFTHSQLSRLSITGRMSDTEAPPVTLQITTPDQTSIEAGCTADVLVIRPGAAQFSLEGCAATLDGVNTPTCSVTLSAGFENCTR